MILSEEDEQRSLYIHQGKQRHTSSIVLSLSLSLSLSAPVSDVVACSLKQSSNECLSSTSTGEEEEELRVTSIVRCDSICLFLSVPGMFFFFFFSFSSDWEEEKKKDEVGEKTRVSIDIGSSVGRSWFRSFQIVHGQSSGQSGDGTDFSHCSETWRRESLGIRSLCSSAQRWSNEDCSNGRRIPTSPTNHPETCSSSSEESNDRLSMGC